MLQVFLFSVLFYSVAGQFMIPNMYLAASPLASIVASVSLVNTRQMLYSASFAPECKGRVEAAGLFLRSHGDRRELRCLHRAIPERATGRLIGRCG